MRLLLLYAALAFGQTDTYWVELPMEGATSEGNLSGPDKVEFWDKLQERGFDEFCKLIAIPVAGGVGMGDHSELAVRYKRSLKRLPDGRFAVVDEAKLGLGLGHVEPLEKGDMPLGVGVTARLEGESIVVRPLEGKRSCQEVDTVLKVWDTKTVLPLRGERISEMMVGELWRLPLTLTVGVNLGAGRELVDSLPFTVTVGASAQGRASVSLKRISQKEVRMRLRLDQATIRDLHGKIVADMATVVLGTGGAENVFMKFLTREASKQLNRYLALTLSGDRDSRLGVNTVLEFVLDPEDPDQMEKLSRALRGELGVIQELQRLAKLAKDRATKGHDSKVDLIEIAGRQEAIIGQDTTFAGLDEYERRRRGLVVKIPLLFDVSGSSSKDKDRIVLLDGEGGEYNMHSADKRRERGYFDIPFMGQFNRLHRERSARVFTYTDKDGTVSEPLAVYIEQTGILRTGDSTAFGLARRADDMMQLLGTKGMGRNPKAALPLPLITPDPEADKKKWKRGLTSLTVAFSPKAIADIVASSAETVLRAVANATGELAARMTEWVLANGALNKNGEFEYDSFRMLEAMGFNWHTDEEDSRRARVLMRQLASDAADLLKDFAAVAAAATPRERAEAFLKVMSGGGKSDLDYDEVMRVLVQLVDPLDVSAEFFTYVSRGKKNGKDIKARFGLHGAHQDPRLEALARARNRFIEPTFLSD
jgi:hypothetical protein